VPPDGSSQMLREGSVIVGGKPAVQFYRVMIMITTYKCVNVCIYVSMNASIYECIYKSMYI